MNHETSPDPATVQADVTTEHKLHRDYETRGRADLRKVGAAVYAADPTTEVICIAYAVDDGPVQRWFPGDPVPPVWFEAAANPNWTAIAHNDPFEAQIETNILHPKHGFPLIPPDRHRCTQAASLALGLPAKLNLLADALEFTHRKDAAGERLMHQLTKPRRPRFGEDPEGTYWDEDPDQIERLSDYNCQDVEVEREADNRLSSLPDVEQAVWGLSNLINDRGFHVDRTFAEAARKIAEAAAPEIDAELAELTAGAVTKIGQVQKIKDWMKTQGCATLTLDSDTIEELLENDELAPSLRRVLEIRAGGAQAAVKKINALLARAGADDRIRGAFKYHGAHTGRWAGEGFQPQNLKRPVVEDLDAAVAAVATGDYEHMKRLYAKPLSVVGDCSRQTITAADGNELIGADLSSIESRALAMVAGEEWKLDAYRKYDATHDPRDEPYCETACRIFGVLSGTYNKKSPERQVGKTCDLAFGYQGGLGAWRKFKPDEFTDEEVQTFKNEWRAAHPNIVGFWSSIDRAAVKAVYEPGIEVVCGLVALESDGKFLKIRLPSGRQLSYPNPRLIVDDRDKARVVYDDNSGGRFTACRGGYGNFGGTWTENIVSGIARDILVEAMFRIEAAGYPIVMHIHDEIVAEVPIGFGSEEEFLELLTRRPSWAPDLPIAACAWRGRRYDKSDKSAATGTAEPAPADEQPPARDKALVMSDTTQDDVRLDEAPGVAADVHAENPQPASSGDTPEPQPTGADDSGSGVTVNFTRYEARGNRLSKLYELGAGRKVIKSGGTQLSNGRYETISIEAADPQAALAEIGTRIDALNFREAIGLGVVRASLPLLGDITTKAKYEKRKASNKATAIPRALSHFGWPSDGCGLLLFDGDEKDGLRDILVELFPDFANVAMLTRPSASASVKDPNTDDRLKTGEHLFVLIDEPAKSKECLQATLRLSWCVGVGRSAGWLALAKDGDPLVYGPVDVTVGSPERLVYEGEISIGKGLERLPRISTVSGGNGGLCAAELLEFANQHAPAKRFDELVLKAKNEPAFLAEQAAVKAAYRADHIEKAVARGEVREIVEREFDRITSAKASTIGGRIWRKLSPHQTLYWPDGVSFTAADMAADPKAFHGKECCDPIEGTDYQTRNCGFILHQGGRVEIYSRAHGDRYAYFLKLFDEEDFAGGGGGGDGGAGGGGGGGGGGSGGSGGLGTASPSPGSQPGFVNKNKPVIQYGPLSVMADAAAKVLIDAEVPFYQRGKTLVRPVVKQVQTFDGKMTSAAQLVEIELPFLRDTLCRHSCWVKYNTKRKKWLDIHPPVDAAQVLLKRFGNWDFPVLAGIITTPTLRSDGTILKDAGYDPATQLLLIDPPAMPDIPDNPTFEDAVAALDLLKDLLFEFPFEKDYDDSGKDLLTSVSRSVALSATISTVCRGAFPVVPMHIIDAPTAGSGKSYLLSTVSRIATGQAMPVLGAGKSEEELEKRLGAAVIHGQALVCVDNIVGEIGGDALCRLIEQPRPSVRILGQSVNVEIDARSVTYFGNGNNIVVVGDLCRRVIRSRLDPQMERPELREFKGDPEDLVMADRGKYIAACLTVCRAYIAAGRPGRLKKLASFGCWSDTVRSALVWLGEADPVQSMDTSKAEDPETSALRTLLTEWKLVFGVGYGNAKLSREAINFCDANKATPEGKEYTHKGLRHAVLSLMPPHHHLKPDADSLGIKLRSFKERRVGKMRFRKKDATGSTPTLWWVEEG